MQLRIYTYKITFEEIPHWYWGVHKERRFGELYLGSPVTHKWMWEFYTPRIQILELFPCTEEGWKEARSVEDRLILPDLNNCLCLNEARAQNLSISACSRGGKSTHSKKDERGKSLRALELNSKLHSVKTQDGKSSLGVENGKRLHSSLNGDGKSINAIKGALKANEKKTPDGKSINALKGAKKANEKKNEDGKSINALKAHAKKDSNGKSLLGLLNAQRLHEKKDEKGRSLQAMESAKYLNRKEWQCLVTGKISTPAGLSHWQRSRGIDTSLRVKVSNKEEL